MPFKAILHEAEQLKNMSGRLELLADQNPLVAEALITISGNIRSTATVMEVLVATRTSFNPGSA